jgi:putative chitinase
MLTLAQLKQMIPRNPYAAEWHEALAQPQNELGGSTLLDDYDINTPKRIAAFVAQCAHESGGFMVLKENLNYKPATLRKIFPKYFPTDEIAEEYCRKPNKQEAIANRVYANRMGNSSEFDTADPPSKWIGRGLIQLTGRANYQAFADSLEMDINDVPAYLATFEGAAQSACWFWETNKLNQWADAGDILTLTKRINGGTIGLNDRIKHYNHALSIMQGSH